MYAPARAQRLWYRQAGSGPAVVLLHGLADSHDLWRHQIGPLAAHHRVVAFDLRGHGRSPLGQSPFSLADMTADVLAAADELNLDRFVLAGLSMGGGVAQMLAIEHPDRVTGLALVSTSSEFPEATRERFVSRAEVAERDGMEAVVDATVPRWFTRAFMESHPDEVQRTRRSVLAIEPDAFGAASRANAVRNLTSRLSRIRCPVLFIGGAEDPADPSRALDIYRREINDLRSHVIPRTSHLVPVEAPDAFNALLLRFLEEAESTRRKGETP